MEEIIGSIADLGLGLGALVLIAYLWIQQTKSSEKDKERQEKKDVAYMETFAKIQSGLDANLSLTKAEAEKSTIRNAEVSKVMAQVSETLSQFSCLKK